MKFVTVRSREKARNTHENIKLLFSKNTKCLRAFLQIRLSVQIRKCGENYGLLILSLFKKYSIEFAFSDCLVDCEKGN